jgi:hypothetical protein
MEIGFLQPNTYQSMQSDLVETRKMLNAFIQKLKGNHYKLTANGE